MRTNEAKSLIDMGAVRPTTLMQTNRCDGGTGHFDRMADRHFDQGERGMRAAHGSAGAARAPGLPRKAPRPPQQGGAFAHRSYFLQLRVGERAPDGPARQGVGVRGLTSRSGAGAGPMARQDTGIRAGEGKSGRLESARLAAGPSRRQGPGGGAPALCARRGVRCHV